MDLLLNMQMGKLVQEIRDAVKKETNGKHPMDHILKEVLNS